MNVATQQAASPQASPAPAAGTPQIAEGTAPAADQQSLQAQVAAASVTGTDATPAPAPAADKAAPAADAQATQQAAKPDDTAGDKPANEPPADYTFKVPEGATAPEAKSLDDLKALAKRANLSQEQAQHLFEGLTELNQSRAKEAAANAEANKAKAQEAQQAAMVQHRVDLFKAAQADPEIGGDKLAAHAALARSSLQQFGNKAFSDLLDGTGLGNHPEVVRFMAKVGRALAGDQSLVVGGRAPQAPARNAANSLYPH